MSNAIAPWLILPVMCCLCWPASMAVPFCHGVLENAQISLGAAKEFVGAGAIIVITRPYEGRFGGCSATSVTSLAYASTRSSLVGPAIRARIVGSQPKRIALPPIAHKR